MIGLEVMIRLRAFKMSSILIRKIMFGLDEAELIVSFFNGNKLEVFPVYPLN